MRPASDVHEVFRLADQGLSRAEIARRVGIARATVRDWLDHGKEAVVNRPMRIAKIRRDRTRQRCANRCIHREGLDQEAYAYLLGQYLGDGCVSTIGSSFRLRVICCDAYPKIMDECATAMRAVLPGVQVGRIQRTGCTEVYATSFHWSCLLPQHGPGPKHQRPIELHDWQREIAIDRHPAPFVRGLVHSDGCRFINRVTIKGKTYEYVRYMFSNVSSDILRLFLDACDQLDIRARFNNWNSVSVARREAVAQMDSIVGPKE